MRGFFARVLKRVRRVEEPVYPDETSPSGVNESKPVGNDAGVELENNNLVAATRVDCETVAKGGEKYLHETISRSGDIDSSYATKTRAESVGSERGSDRINFFLSDDTPLQAKIMVTHVMSFLRESGLFGSDITDNMCKDFAKKPYTSPFIYESNVTHQIISIYVSENGAQSFQLYQQHAGESKNIVITDYEMSQIRVSKILTPEVKEKMTELEIKLKTAQIREEIDREEGVRLIKNLREFDPRNGPANMMILTANNFSDLKQEGLLEEECKFGSKDSKNVKNEIISFLNKALEDEIDKFVRPSDIATTIGSGSIASSSSAVRTLQIRDSKTVEMI